jgi:superfamily II DNA or RNA helicase
MLLDLRPYQSAAFDQARELIRQGKRRILVVAPTGSGKTVLATALMEMTVAKGNRATFVVDRLSLIDQTSAMFDRYGVEHGVVQAQHPRFRLYERVQVCSVQTLAKRGWPESQVDVFDEAHVLHACHKRRMADDSIVIGLTATPFTRGLAKYFDAVINVTTTRKLIHEGYLAKYRIFSCAEPDMEGARVKSTGDWD